MNQPEELNQPEESLAALDAEFAQQLTHALRPVAPPEGFADRTMARLQPSEPVCAKVVAMKSRPPLWAGGAIAAAILAGAFFAEQAHTRHQRQKAELAQRQFEAGLRITDRTLEHVRQQLLQAGIPIGN